MYALRRMQAGSGTWYWVVNFRRRGQRYSQRFYEPKHGGSDAAKRAAIAWRDEQLAQAQILSMVEFCCQQRSNNTSGMPGVHFVKAARQPQGAWQAKLKLGGKSRTKSFSVRTHGWQRAYEMALAAREQMLTEAAGQDRPYLYDKLAKRIAANAKTALV